LARSFNTRTDRTSNIQPKAQPIKGKNQMEIVINASAFDRSNMNRRPAFAMKQRLRETAPDCFTSNREWTGVGSQAIASEEVRWENGLQKASTHIGSLEESCEATVSLGASCWSIDSRLTSHLTHGQPRFRGVQVPYPPVTLSSLPFLIAQHWQVLMNGESVYASYLVLKVQRAATVKIQRKPMQEAPNEIQIKVVPTNWLLRLVFGATTLHFLPNSASLVKINGLLDPRDRKPNGRWREYKGTLEFDEPWDLKPLLPAKEKRI
jgi:hypothetical protein